LVTKNTSKRFTKMRNDGSVLVLATMVVFFLAILGLGLLTAAYGARLRAAKLRREATAKLVAEAGYEAAILWLNQQADVLSAMTRSGRSSGTRTINESSSPTRFPNSNFIYSIRFDRFFGSQPVYEIVSEGYCDLFSRTIKASVVQQVSGWDMALCEIPTGTFSSTRAWYTGGDIVAMPIHINNNSQSTPNDSTLDIHVRRGATPPQFSYKVAMGESRYTWWGRNKDKYSSIIDFFDKGIYFDQSGCNVTDPFSADVNSSVALKVGRFMLNTRSAFRITPDTATDVTSALVDANPTWASAPAVQLEFFVTGGGVGMVRITNNCTVCCVPGAGNDYMLATGQVDPYTLYPIYGYHYADGSGAVSYPIGATYVSQQTTAPSGRAASANVGGQIYVNGNVIIGGEVGTDADGNMVVEVGGAIFPSRLRGQLTVVATGNIWIVSPIVYAGSHDVAYEGGFLTKQVPSSTNQNVLGLFSQFGVVKVVDPGLSLNVPTTSQDVTAVYGPEQYSPIGYQNSLSPFIANRLLPPSMVVQAAITACGGGFGAENVGARLNANASGKDILIVAGSITESVQGRVAYINNGFRRCYYFDGRLLTGILPGDMWLQSKYVPTPGGWSDSRL
jgi:hypothetical protein